MAKAFECMIRIPDIDLGNIDAARASVMDVINGEQFSSLCENLSILSVHSAAGPAPRGGEAKVECKVNDKNEKQCSGSVSLSW